MDKYQAYGRKFSELKCLSYTLAAQLICIVNGHACTGRTTPSGSLNLTYFQTANEGNVVTTFSIGDGD